jgi:hypothetical protein
MPATPDGMCTQHLHAVEPAAKTSRQAELSSSHEQMNMSQVALSTSVYRQ